MKRFALVVLSLLVLIASLGIVSAQEDDMMAAGPHVFEVVIREVVDAETFNELQPQLIEASQAVEGFVGNLEYTAFVNFTGELDENIPVIVEIVEYESIDAYNASLENAGITDLLEAYNASAPLIADVVVEPFVKGEAISLDDFPDAGEVLEVAIRDLSSYEDPVDFIRTIQGFTDALGREEGVLREYQWISTDGATFVGMTRYASAEAFAAVSQSETIFAMPNTQYAFATYPPMIGFATFLSE